MRKRKVLVAGVISLVLLTGFTLLVPTIFKDQVALLLNRKLNETINARVSFTAADINLWRNFPQFTVTLDNFSVAGKHNFKGDTLIKTKSLHLVFSSVQLIFKDRIQVTELNFDDPAFHIITLKDGSANYEVFNTASDSIASSQGDEVSLDIQSCNIMNAAFLYEDHQQQIEFQGNETELTGWIDFESNIIDLDVNTTIKNFSASYEGEKYIINKDLTLALEAEYNTETSLLSFKRNVININHLGIDIAGSYAYQNNGHYFDLRLLSSDNNFRDLLSLSDEFFADDFKGIDIRGHLFAEGFIKGRYHATTNVTPSFRFEFKVNDGDIRYKGLKSSISNIELDLVAENNDSLIEKTILDFKTFSFNLGQNPVKGSVSISGLTNSRIKSDVTATMNLADFQNIYPLPGISLAGNVKAELHVNGTNQGQLHEIPQRLIRKKGSQIPAFDLSLSIKDASLKYDTLPESISGIHFNLRTTNKTGVMDSTVVRIDQLQARFGDNPMKGFLHVKGLTKPRIESELTASMDFSDVKNFIPMNGIDARGMFDIDMKVNGRYDDSLRIFPKVNMRMNVVDGFLKSPKYPYPMENCHLVLEAINRSGDFRDTKLNIDTLTYSIEGESFFIRGSVSDMEKVNYNLAVNGILYLDKLGHILHLQDDIKMSGEIDVNVRTAGTLKDLQQKKYHRLPTNGKVSIKDIDIHHPSFPGNLKIKTGHLSFSNERIHLDTLHGTWGSSHFEVTGHLSNHLAYVFHADEKIKGDLFFRSDTLNLNELLREEDAKIRDTTAHELEVFEIPKNFEFTLETQIQKLRYQYLVATEFNGSVSVKDGILALQKTTFNSMNADFTISGDYDTRDLNHPRFDLDINVVDLDIGEAHNAFVTIQAMAPAAGDTYGIFSMNYKLEGELAHDMRPLFNTLKGKGTLRIREAKINGMKLFHHISGMTKKEELKNPELKDIVMETEIQNGILTVKPFNMKLAGFDTDIEGQHHIDGSMNYILRMGLPPFDIVKIPLHVDGTYDKPRIRLGKGHEDSLNKISSVNP